MKQGKRILSFILILALLVGLVPVGKDNVKEAEASEQYPSVPDTVIADADELYSGQGMKLFFPDVIEVPKGTYGNKEVEQDKLIAVFYKNTTHARFDEDGDGAADDKFPYGELCIAESIDGGATWSTPQSVITQQKLTDWGIYKTDANGDLAYDASGNPVYFEARDPDLTLLKDGTLILTFYVRNASHDTENCQVYICESTDGGTTWSTEAPYALPHSDWGFESSARRGGIAVLSDGSVVIPFNGHRKTDTDQGDWLNSVITVACGTRTGANQWSFTGAMEIIDTKGACGIEGVTYGSANTPYVNEASCVATADDDTLYLFMRQTGYVYKSTDKGVNWTYLTKENYPVGTQINQPGLELLSDGSIYVTYAIPATTYGRPVYGKQVVLDTEAEADGWNATTPQLIYHSPSSTSECGDPSSVPLDTNDDGTTDKILVVYYDGAENYIAGTFVDMSGNSVEQDAYTPLTLKDFGVSTVREFENVQGTTISTSASTDTLDGKSITGIYNLSTTAGDRIIFGGSYSGIKVSSSGDSLQVDIYDQTSRTSNKQSFRIAPANLDGKSLVGRDITMKVTFKFENEKVVDSTLTTVDVLFGITINDTYSTHMLFKGLNKDFLKQIIGIHATAGTPTTLTDVSYADIEKLDLFDFGITSLESSSNKVSFKIGDGTGSLDGKSLTGIYNFSSTGSAVVTIGSYNSDRPGLEIGFYQENLTIQFIKSSWVPSTGSMSIKPSDVDSSYSSLKGRDLKIEMFFDLVEQPDSTTDLIYTIIIDDKFTNTVTFEEVSASLLTEAITIRNTGVKIADVGYYNAEVLTPSDFGVETMKELRGQTDGKRKIETDSPTETLNNKKITGIYNFSHSSSILYGSSQWGGSVRLTAYTDGQNQYFATPEIWTGAGFTPGTPTADTSTVNGYIYSAYQLGGKEIVDSDLKIEAYFRFKDDGTNDTQDLTVIFWIEDVYRFTYTWDSVNTSTLVETISTNPDVNFPVLVMEPSVYPDGLLPNASGATLATNEDILRMKFDFSGVLDKIAAKGETILSYGGVVVAGTKDAATMQEKAKEMIDGDLSESGVYKRTEKSGDAITRLVESDDPAYYITITNSGTLENMAKRATAIGYIKTDQGIYYTTDCENADKQLVNRSVYGVLKKIFEVNYVADYDAATVKEDTILYKAVEKYTKKEGAVQKTAEEVAAIVKSSDKSNDETRALLSGVHYAIPELWDGANAALKGKYISILGHSIDSYAGVSNDTNANTTIGNNSCTYPNTFSLTQEDMWWSQVIKDKGMNLLVCNASSGAAVSYATGDGNIIGTGSDDARALQLHDDNGENAGKTPDIIAVTLGINDFRSGQGIGTFDASVWNQICVKNADDTYTYTARGGYFADHYAIMLHKIITRYPDAKVFVFNIFESNETLCNTRTNLQEYNEMIATIAAYFGVTVVDAYNDTGINRANANDYAFDGLHFNALGMKKYANAFEIALMEKFAQ